MAEVFNLTIAAAPEYVEATADPGDIAPITDMCADGLSVLLGQYENSTTLRAWICAALAPMQQVETDANAVRLVLDIDTNTAEQLDRIGALIGEDREGRSDAEYRRGLRTRILVNRSNGKAEDLIAIVERWHADATTVGYTEHYPATAIITPRPTTADPVRLFRRLQQAKAAGVRLILVDETSADRPYRWASTLSTVESAPLTGLGYPGDSVGGLLQYALG